MRRQPEFDMRLRLFVLLFLFAAVAARGAPAETPTPPRLSTLEQVKKRGLLLCGVSVAERGFARQDDAGVWSGFDIDYCRALAAAIFDDPGKFVVAPLSAKERAAALQSGAADVIARGGAWTQSRDVSQKLLYAAVSFYDGQGFLAHAKPSDAPKDAPKDALKDAPGPTRVCAQQGTAHELDLADYIRARRLNEEIRPFPTLEEAARAYDAGECELLSADLSTLHALRAGLAAPAEHALAPQLVSKAPLGPVVRQGDDQWFNIVRWTHFAMVNAEELGLARAGVDAALKSENPQIRRLLGVDGDHGEGLGLEPDWAYRIVKHVGNYGEVFDRHFGKGVAPAPALERRLNALWSDGGLMFAPPVK
jgi:general L-amino acid transport system substrate-binding protein